MTQFAIYSVCGFSVAFFNLFMWGFSNGPINTIPYFAVVGSLLLIVASAPVALFLPRIAAATAIINVSLILPWPFLILLTEKSFTGFAILSFLPIVSVVIAIRSLWKTRHKNWFLIRSSPSLVIRVPLAFLPTVIFVLTFNAKLVLTLLLQGPPHN